MLFIIVIILAVAFIVQVYKTDALIAETIEKANIWIDNNCYDPISQKPLVNFTGLDFSLKEVDMKNET